MSSGGRRVVNFILPDANGQQAGLADFNDNRVVVLFFMGTHCPIANLDLK
jgi:peroxiredoxin